MTLPAEGTLTMAQINAEFGRGNDLNAYRGTAHTGGTFPSGQIAFSDFYGKSAGPPLLGYYTGRLNFSAPGILARWTGSIAVGPFTCDLIEFSPTPNSPAWTLVRFPAGQPGATCRLLVDGIFDGTTASWGDLYGTPTPSFIFSPIGADFSGNRDVQIWVYG